jgi:hypothetical protein
MKSLTQITVNGLTFHFSYTTLVAVQNSTRLVVHKNIWSHTKGKHLNRIDGGAVLARVDASLFNEAVAEMCTDHEINEVPTLR